MQTLSATTVGIVFLGSDVKCEGPILHSHQTDPGAEEYSENSVRDSRAQADGGLLDDLVSRGQVGTGKHDGAMDQLREFLDAPSVGDKLRSWLSTIPRSESDRKRAQRVLARDIARIDQLLTEQVNAILHSAEFQALESAWRGLHYLWSTREHLLLEHGFDEQATKIEIRVLNVSKRELTKDFEKASEFDQNSLFQKVYEEEFGTPGGTPYGVLLANFEFTNHPDDLDLLSAMSGVAASAFAPMIAAASPQLMGLDDFTDLEKPVNLEQIFRQVRHRKWQSLRQKSDTQFVGLTLPRILMREPYRDDDRHRHGFRFHEDVQGASRTKYLWGSSAWAMGAVLLRAFDSCGWFADIRGVERGIDGGGLVSGLPTHSFHTDSFGVATRSSVEVSISEAQDAELCNLGFIPLSHCKGTQFSAFYSNQSVHEPPVFDEAMATANARISAMLQYVLCCSRIAHYVKVKGRAKIGSQQSPIEVQNELQDWLMNYVMPDAKASAAMKAKYPLREAEVEVTDVPGQPGKYMMTMRLLPHYQLDQLSSSMTLVARRVEEIRN